MPFTPKRYTEIHTELARLQAYLAALADEIDAVEPNTNKHGAT